MTVQEGEGGEFELLGRSFHLYHGINYTQVFETGDAEELLHFHGKRLSIDEATIATFAFIRGHEIGERVGAGKLRHQLAQLLGVATQEHVDRLGERLDRQQINGIPA
jgi:hypothetical protein